MTESLIFIFCPFPWNTWMVRKIQFIEIWITAVAHGETREVFNSGETTKYWALKTMCIAACNLGVVKSDKGQITESDSLCVCYTAECCLELLYPQWNILFLINFKDGTTRRKCQFHHRWTFWKRFPEIFPLLAGNHSKLFRKLIALNFIVLMKTTVFATLNYLFRKGYIWRDSCFSISYTSLAILLFAILPFFLCKMVTTVNGITFYICQFLMDVKICVFLSSLPTYWYRCVQSLHNLIEIIFEGFSKDWDYFPSLTFIRCISGSSKAILLVTHQLQYLKAVDRILIIKEVR